MNVFPPNSQRKRPSFFSRRTSKDRSKRSSSKTDKKTGSIFSRFRKSSTRSKSATRAVSNKGPSNLHARNVTKKNVNLGYSPTKLQNRSENSGLVSPRVYTKKKSEGKKLPNRKPNAVPSENLANSAPLTPLNALDIDLLNSTHSRDSIKANRGDDYLTPPQAEDLIRKIIQGKDEKGLGSPRLKIGPQKQFNLLSYFNTLVQERNNLSAENKRLINELDKKQSFADITKNSRNFQLRDQYQKATVRAVSFEHDRIQKNIQNAFIIEKIAALFSSKKLGDLIGRGGPFEIDQSAYTQLQNPSYIQIISDRLWRLSANQPSFQINVLTQRPKTFYEKVRAKIQVFKKNIVRWKKLFFSRLRQSFQKVQRFFVRIKNRIFSYSFSRQR